MTETTTKTKRAPESPEARIARADRVAARLARDRRQLLLVGLTQSGPRIDFAEDAEVLRVERDNALARVRAEYAARIAERETFEQIAKVYDGLDDAGRSRLVRMIETQD